MARRLKCSHPLEDRRPSRGFGAKQNTRRPSAKARCPCRLEEYTIYVYRPNENRKNREAALRRSREVAAALIRAASSSLRAVAIAPLQDLLNLGNEARMSVPRLAEGNWAGRARKTC
jgi:4-alpha-glucanotransferase